MSSIRIVGSELCIKKLSRSQTTEYSILSCDSDTYGTIMLMLPDT